MVKWRDDSGWPPDDSGWPPEQDYGSGSEWHSGDDGSEYRTWDSHCKGKEFAWKRPHTSKSKGKAKGKGKGKWEGYGSASSDAWPDHEGNKGKGKGKGKGMRADAWPGPYYQRPVSSLDDAWNEAHWPPPPPAAWPNPNIDKTDQKAEDEKRDALIAQEAARQASVALKTAIPLLAQEAARQASEAALYPSALCVKVPSTDFPSAINIMEADSKQYWVQKTRDLNGNWENFCCLCNKFLTHNHIGYGSKSMHRTRRLDPGSYFPLEKLEPWKVQEAQRMQQEDEEEDKCRKIDEAQRCVDADMALARQAPSDLVEQAMMSIPNPLPMTE